MGMGNRNGLMEQYTLVIGVKVKRMEMVNLHM
jgi:hypothetical protein